MLLKFYQNNTPVSLELGSVNVFYGFSGCGKTIFSKDLEQGLLGKDKSFSLNGLSIGKEDNNVIYIDSKESIIDHLKLTSKSYLKKLYYTKVLNYLNDNSKIISNINENFTDLNEILLSISNKFNSNSSITKLKLSFKFDNLDELINNFIKVDLSTNSISSTHSREMLFNLITLLSNDEEKYNHIIIDDFDSFLDEESMINFFNLLNNFKGNVYLFTNKPNSLIYCIDRFNIYNIRYDKFINFTNLSYIYKNFMSELFSNENNTYEEYMLNYGYISKSGIEEENYLNIKRNSVYNLGRMLTSKTYTITNTISNNNISIFSSNNYEEKFLKFVDNLINND